MAIEAEIGHKAKIANGHRKPEEAKNSFFPTEPSEGAWPCQTSGLQNCKGTCFCCFKQPSLWQFVTAYSEN